MPKQKERPCITGSRIKYIIESSVQYIPELGEYVSYDIAAFDSGRGAVVERVADVTTDRTLALSLAERFTRYGLSPVHLKEAVLDMLP